MIVVAGILIAIGLEQAVEFFHHRHQVAETMEALQEERQQNIKRFAHVTAAFHAQTIRYQTNLAVLLYIKAHPASLPVSWPGEVNWHTVEFSFSDSAWSTAQQDNVSPLMSQQEVRAQQDLYHALGIVEAASVDRNRAITDVRRFMVQDSNPLTFRPPNWTMRSCWLSPCSSFAIVLVPTCATSTRIFTTSSPVLPRWRLSTSFTSRTRQTISSPGRLFVISSPRRKAPRPRSEKLVRPDRAERRANCGVAYALHDSERITGHPETELGSRFSRGLPRKMYRSFRKSPRFSQTQCPVGGINPYSPFPTWAGMTTS